jgi:hypothetical protein
VLFELMDGDLIVDYNLMIKSLHHHLMKICKLTMTSHPPLYTVGSLFISLKGHLNSDCILVGQLYRHPEDFLWLRWQKLTCPKG